MKAKVTEPENTLLVQPVSVSVSVLVCVCAVQIIRILMSKRRLLLLLLMSVPVVGGYRRKTALISRESSSFHAHLASHSFTPQRSFVCLACQLSSRRVSAFIERSLASIITVG